MSQKPYVLITAGGTSVPMDHVRSVTNEAKGSFGVLLANEFVSRDMKVVLLCTRTTQHFYPVLSQFYPVIYGTYDEYVAAIDSIVAEHGIPMCAISAAAVSDFAPEMVVAGKIPSGEAYTVTFIPLPKVLATWREKFGKECYIVGCKLTDRSNGFEHLLAAARKQNTNAHLNLTVANYNPWQQKKEGADREVWLVKPDNGFLHVKGTHEAVTHDLVDFIVRQMHTTWVRSVRNGAIVEALRIDMQMRLHLNQVMGHADRLLAFSKDANLLNGSPGNVVFHDPVFPITAVTPRAHPHKENLLVTDMVLARLMDGQIQYWSEDASRKPSIDTLVYELIFKEFEMFDMAIHFHDGWVLNVVSTEQDFPCGCKEEAESIAQAIEKSQNRSSVATITQPVMIELIRHGHTLFMSSVVFSTHSHLSMLESQWNLAYNAYIVHLAQIGKRAEVSKLRLMPVFNGHSIVGVAAQHREEGWYSFFLRDNARGKGLGEKLVQLAIERRVKVGVHENCHVEQFYVDHGFTVIDRKDGLCVLQAPSKF